jgi:hypothetical protein
MRLFRFKTHGLTLALSIVVEVLFVLGCLFLGDARPNWLSQTFKSFHYPAYFLIFGWLDPDSGDILQVVLWCLFMFSVAVFQWWLIILASVWVFRHFRTKSV